MTIESINFNMPTLRFGLISGCAISALKSGVKQTHSKPISVWLKTISDQRLRSRIALNRITFIEG